MEISKDIRLYGDDIVKMSYENYKKEVAGFEFLPVKSFDDFKRYMNENMAGINGLVYLEEKECTAFLLYNVWEENKEIYCSIPEWGYGSVSKNREKAMSYLFQALASDIVSRGTVNFSVHLYAHDMEMQRLFSYMEFGIQAETGICSLDGTNPADADFVRELQKEEVSNRWDEIWCLLEHLIQHLRMSPVFYPGKEFSEEVYKEFFMDEGTRVFAAENNDKIIGVIEANQDNISFLFSDREAANVGEVYVLPEYRRKNISYALLHYAKEKLLQSDYRYVWVEHGTANPNARYFWNRYFTTYKYEMIRRINQVS